MAWKRNFIVILSASLAVQVSTPGQSAPKVEKPLLTPKKSLDQLSRALDDLKNTFKLDYNKKPIYLSGETAIQFLESVFYNKTLRLADFDIQMVDPGISESQAHAYSLKLQTAGVSQLKQIGKKTDSNGWTLLHNHIHTYKLLDLAIFPNEESLLSKAEISSNKKIYIKIPPGESLNDVAQDLELWWKHNQKADQVHLAPHVIDRKKKFSKISKNF